jgi:hypothetical protein
VHELAGDDPQGRSTPATDSPPPPPGGSLERKPTRAPSAATLGGGITVSPELRAGAVSGDRIRAAGWQIGINMTAPLNERGTSFNAGIFRNQSSGTLDGQDFSNAATGVSVGLTHPIPLDARTTLTLSPQLRLTRTETNGIGSLQFDLRPTVGLTRNLIDGDVKVDLGVQLTPGLTSIWNAAPAADQLQFRPSARVEAPISFGKNKLTPYYNLDLRFDTGSGQLVGEGHTVGLDWTRSINRNLQFGVGVFHSLAVDPSRQIVNRSAFNGVNNAGGTGLTGFVRWTF